MFLSWRLSLSFSCFPRGNLVPSCSGAYSWLLHFWQQQKGYTANTVHSQAFFALAGLTKPKNPVKHNSVGNKTKDECCRKRLISHRALNWIHLDIITVPQPNKGHVEIPLLCQQIKLKSNSLIEHLFLCVFICFSCYNSSNVKETFTAD